MGFWKGRGGLYVAAFLLDMTMAAAGFAVPLYAIELGASGLALGVIGASAFAYTLVCLFSGRLSDRLGRRTVAALGCVLVSAAYLAIPHTRTLPTLFVFAVAVSFSIALIWPPVQAWLSEQPDRRSLSSSIGIFNVSWSIGIAAGPIVGARLVKLDPQLSLPFHVAAGFALLSILIMYAIKTDGRPVEDLQPAETPPAGAATFLYIAWVTNFASWFASSCVRALLPKLTREMHVDDVTLGWLIGSLMAAQTLMFLILQFSQKWRYRLAPLVLFPCGSAAGMLLVFFAADWRLWFLGLTLIGLGCGMTYYASLFYTLFGRATGQGKATGFHEAILGSGLVFGPLLGGISVRLSGGNLKAPYLLAACVIMITVTVAIGIYIRAARRHVAGRP